MSKDKIEHEEKGDADMNWDNKVFGFNWFQISDSPLFFELGVSASSFSGEVIPNQSSAREKKNDVKDVNVRMDFHYVYDSKDELGLGLNILDLDTKLFLENSLGAPTDLSSRGTNFSFYLKYKFLRVKNLGVEIGSRVNVGGLTKKGGSFLPEPRFSFSYRIIPEIAIKGAWGIFQQEVTTLSDENELISLFEPWIIIPPYLEPERSKHFILGTEVNLTTDISFELEGYYKDSKNLAMINESKIYPTDNDFVSGSGESYGFESMLKLNFGNFNFSGGYSMSWAYNELNGWLFYPKYDARHACNLSLEYAFADGWQFSAVWTYSTGMPFTKLTGFYDKLNFEDIFTLSNMGNYFKPYLMLGDKNLGRLPSYHRLDMNLSRKFTTNLFNLYLDLSILNVYDRKNIFYFERDTGKRINMLPFLPTATLKIEI
jgi:hypothetical protein